MAEPLNNIDQFRQRISQLREELQKASPGYEQHLFLIHKQLSEDEEMTHMLSEDEIGVIVAALAKKKNVVIADVGKSSKSGSTKLLSGKRIKDLGLEDL